MSKQLLRTPAGEWYKRATCTEVVAISRKHTHERIIIYTYIGARMDREENVKDKRNVVCVHNQLLVGGGCAHYILCTIL